MMPKISIDNLRPRCYFLLRYGLRKEPRKGVNHASQAKVEATRNRKGQAG